ncbi:MAG: FAD-dependent oxidoreductase [Oscillospiraceae bacterium]|nr:FAD-dependent oxidoreductase [Oscillospiraceae bacterium]
MNTIKHKPDVLIIGGGSAGMWAAKRLKERAPELDVLIVDKGGSKWGGLMRLSGGDFEAVLPGEDVNDWVKDLTYYWDGLCEQDVVADLFRRAYDRLEEYHRMGCGSLTDEEGKLRGVPQRGLPHVRLYPTKFKGTGGQVMADAMAKEMDRLGVTYLGRVQISGLVKDEKGRAVGAVGFDCCTGDFLEISARCVIMAAGPASWKPGYNGNTSTGEWVRLCFDGGCKLRNFDTLTVMNAPRKFFWEGQGIYLAFGAKFVNAQGEDFMARYSPSIGSNTDNNFICRGMALEMKAGRGPICFDLSGVPEDRMEFVRPNAGNQLLNHTKLKDAGINFLTDTDIEFIPQVQLTNGGVWTDIKGRTGVPGLYAAGRCRSIDYIYMGGFGLSSTAVTGWIAGDAVADELAAGVGWTGLPRGQVERLREALYAPMKRSGGQMPHQVLRKLNGLMARYDVCLLQSEESLTAARAELGRICAEDLPEMCAPDFHYLAKYNEVEGIAFLTRLFLEASLARRESRGSHYRVDYPKRDERYLGWFIHTKGGAGEVLTEFVPVPTGRYPNPVDRFYTDNFRFDAE